MKKATIVAEAYASKEDVYDFLMDFKNYTKYSKYAKNTRLVVDGENPEWEIDFRWWLVKYTAKSKVTDYRKPDFIEWRVVKDADVRGEWHLEEIGDEHTRLQLDLRYDPKGASKANPLWYFPTDKLIKLAKPVVLRHVNNVLRNVTKELEGEPREANFKILYEDTGEEDQFLELVPDDNLEGELESQKD
ncbi:MAG: SRPBCC family protein [Halobacteria archaeon]